MLTDTQWIRIRSFLKTCSGLYVRNEAQCRLFIEALCWMACTGAPWRQLPPAYGKWNTVYRRYADWCDRGLWPRLLEHMQNDPELSAVLRDTSVGRASASAQRARPRKRRSQPADAVGAAAASRSVS